MQISFGSRYRDIFKVDAGGVNKTYFSMIKELLRLHPSAGRLYVGLIAFESIILLLMIVSQILIGEENWNSGCCNFGGYLY